MKNRTLRILRPTLRKIEANLRRLRRMEEKHGVSRKKERQQIDTYLTSLETKVTPSKRRA